MVVVVHARASLWRSPWTFVLAAFALRAAVMITLRTYQYPAAQDHYLFGTEMGRVARSLVTGGGFASPLHGKTGPTAMVGPVYPLIIAAAFKLFGIYSTRAAVVLLTLNALLSALTAAVVFLIGRSAFNERTGIWAGWAWVFFPLAVYWPVLWVWDTSLSGLMFGLIFLATLRLVNSMRTRDAAWYGASWGVTVLTNTTFLPLFPAFLGWLCYRRVRVGTSWLPPAAAAVLAFGIVLAPWIVRNEFVFGHALLRSNFGLELAQGNSPGANGPRAWWLHPAFNEAEMARYRELGELRYMAAKQREATEFIRRDPGRFARATAMRIHFFWFATESPAHVLDFPEVLYGFTSVLALAGLGVALVRRSPAGFPFAAVAALFPLVYYVTHPDARFRHLIEPQLFVLAAYAGLAAVTRRAAAVPASPLTLGGQAVIEGVMVRSPRFASVTVRAPEGACDTRTVYLPSLVLSRRWLRAPFLRGGAALVESLYVGTWALMISARGTQAAEIALPRRAIALSLARSLVISIALFFLAPAIVARALADAVPSPVGQSLLEGAVRIAFVLGFLALIGRIPAIERVFQYHGAEHKVIHTYEAGLPLDVESAERSSRFHPRCGTTFLLIVLLVAVVVFAALGQPPLPVRLAQRILLLPVVAAVSYELLRAAQRYSGLKLVTVPGLWLQRLTTREPDDQQLRVALAALCAVLTKEREWNGGAGVATP